MPRTRPLLYAAQKLKFRHFLGYFQHAFRAVLEVYGRAELLARYACVNFTRKVDQLLREEHGMLRFGRGS